MICMARAAATAFVLAAAAPAFAQDAGSAPSDAGAPPILSGLMSTAPVARIQRMGSAAPLVALPPDSSPVAGLGSSSTAVQAPDLSQAAPSLVPPLVPTPADTKIPGPASAPQSPKTNSSAPPANPAGSVIRGLASVIDGDTLSVKGVTVRLSGVDAMDLRQTCWKGGLTWACGEKAAGRLNELAAGKLVRCIVTRPEQKWVNASCETAGTDLAKSMIRDGLALPLNGAAPDYVQMRDEARAAGSGVWTGEFQAPWEWRKAPRTVSASGNSNR